MDLKRRVVLLLPVVAFAGALSAAAGPLSQYWTAKDIGQPSEVGSTDVEGVFPTWVWTIQGSGAGIFTQADSFHYAYQPVQGDASITARFQRAVGGDPELAQVGLMVRENDTAGSPNLTYSMTPGAGLAVTVRSRQDGPTDLSFLAGLSNQPEADLFMRLQRAGNEISGFYSRDGRLWFQAVFPPQTLPTLTDQALFGLAVTSHRDGELIAAYFDQVNLQPGIVSTSGLTGCGGDRRVLLQWQPVKNTLGYTIYRGEGDATGDQMTRLNGDRVAEASFTDTSANLVNGTPLTYGVAPLFPGAGGSPVEGPVVAVQATPVAVPPGYLGCSINERRPSGSVRYDPATGRITLSSSGGGIAGSADECYFLYRKVEGDVQITVKMIAQPTLASGRAGLMIRESLDAGARGAGMMVDADLDLYTTARATASGDTETLPATTTKGGGVRIPVLLQLTRRGNTVTCHYSIDDGRSFQMAAPPVTWASPLGPTLYVGLAGTATDRGQVSVAQFANLHVAPPGGLEGGS